MKSKKLVILLFTLVLSIGLFPMSVLAASTPLAEDSTASVTVQNAVKDDELAAYKVIDITYNASTNHLTYAWNSDFANYFTDTTVEAFAALESDSDALKNKLAGLPAYIATNSISSVDTKIVGADKTAVFSNLAMGEYFIRPTSSTSVYQLMLQKVEPTVENHSYVLNDVIFSAKHNEVSITKTADKTSVTKGEKVNYTVTVDVPSYSAEATNKAFSITDKLSDGLTLDTSSINVKIDSTDVDTTAYTLSTNASDYAFKLSVDTDKYTANWSANGGKQLVITYSATLNDDNTTEVNTPETNTAEYEYSYYPYEDNSTKKKTAEADVNTFAIKIDKYDAGEESTKLENAKFDLYRTATQAEINAGSTVTIPHTTVSGIKLESDVVTDENGSATFAKYQANGTNYDYYLVETQAPHGYNILENAVKVNFTDSDVSSTNGVYTVKVPNNSGFILPITGGKGVALFTVIGIAFMGCAVFLFIISRKKAKANDKK